MQIPPEHSCLLMDAARMAIRLTLSGNSSPSMNTQDPILTQPAGCFVSLHRQDTHALRGCVGRLDARSPLLQAVHETAAEVIDDPRFVDNPVRLMELPDLNIEISVVSPLLQVDDPQDFDLLNHGIYLKFGDRAGCFLPQVARETGWSRQQLLDRLCTEKLGLPAMVWKHPQAVLFRFTACILGPEPFE
jgi:AmmeMemoRadiSam system protein A